MRTALPLPSIRPAGLAFLAVALGSCRAVPAPEVDAHSQEEVAAPPNCDEVIRAGTALQPAIDSAHAGAVLCLEPGEHRGPIVIKQPLTLWGPGSAVVRSSGVGTTVSISGERIRLAGFTIDGSGARYDVVDAGLRVGGKDHIVEGLKIRHAVFGITVEQASRVTVRRNAIEGDSAEAMGLRGDSIRLWETRDSLVEDNTVRDGRDVVVWYSPKNTLRRNRVEGGRYGTHFMYSSDCTVQDNQYLNDVVGIFVMYSRNIDIRGNVLAGASGPAGIGLGVKESGNLKVQDNRLLRNTTGLYIDTSPLYDDDHNTFSRNEIRLSESGVVFHASRPRNNFLGNLFRDNHVQLAVEGGGDALTDTWDRNAFDDYAGYDFDGDGIGDVPYELKSLSGALLSRFPDLSFLQGAPALSMVDAIGQIVPLYRPQPLLIDRHPRIALELGEVHHAN